MRLYWRVSTSLKKISNEFEVTLRSVQPLTVRRRRSSDYYRRWA